MTANEDIEITGWKFSDLEKIHKIWPHPQHILGREVWWTLKYDGTNLCIWNKDGEVMVSTRNTESAVSDIQNALRRTYQWPRLEKLVRVHPDVFAFGELLIKGKSPTGIERHKIDRFVGFAMRSFTRGTPPGYYMPLDEVYKIYSEFKIPTAPIWATSRHSTLDDLYDFNDEMERLAKSRRREGVIGKTIDGRFMWKTKPDRKRRRRKKAKGDMGESLPPLPETEAFGAVDKVFADIGWESFQNVKEAMPKVAEYIQNEMKKHECGPPLRNFYLYYKSYLGDKMEAMKE